MPLVTVVIFALVYLGMALGRFPGLLLDRTGVALLGLIALLATEGLTLEDAAAAIDLPTITLSGAKIGFFDFARSGIPLTLLTMAVTCLWLVYRGIISL